MSLLENTLNAIEKIEIVRQNSPAPQLNGLPYQNESAVCFMGLLDGGVDLSDVPQCCQSGGVGLRRRICR